MDDAFVADCLNCFKPFNAFRENIIVDFVGKSSVPIALYLSPIASIEISEIMSLIKSFHIMINYGSVNHATVMSSYT